MNMTTHTNTTVGGGIGAALGIILVVGFNHFSANPFGAEVAAVMTGAFGIVFSWLVKYLPKPKE